MDAPGLCATERPERDENIDTMETTLSDRSIDGPTTVSSIGGGPEKTHRKPGLGKDGRPASPTKPSAVLASALETMIPTRGASGSTSLEGPERSSLPDFGLYSQEELTRLESELKMTPPRRVEDTDGGMVAVVEDAVDDTDWEFMQLSAWPPPIDDKPEATASVRPTMQSTTVLEPLLPVTTTTPSMSTTTIKDNFPQQPYQHAVVLEPVTPPIKKPRGRPPKNAATPPGTKKPTKKQQQQQQQQRKSNNATESAPSPGKKTSGRQSSATITTTTTTIPPVIPATVHLTNNNNNAGDNTTMGYGGMTPMGYGMGGDATMTQMYLNASTMNSATAMDIQSLVRVYVEKEKASLNMDFQAKVAQLDMRVTHLNTVNSELKAMVDKKDEEIKRHKEEERRLETDTLKAMVASTFEKMGTLKKEYEEERRVLERNLENERRDVDELRKTNAALKRGYDDMCQKFMSLGTEFVDFRVRVASAGDVPTHSLRAIEAGADGRKRKRRASNLRLGSTAGDETESSDEERQHTKRRKLSRSLEIRPHRESIESSSVSPIGESEGAKTLESFVTARSFMTAKTKLDESLETSTLTSLASEKKADQDAVGFVGKKRFEMTLSKPKTAGILRVSKPFETSKDEETTYECCQQCHDACLYDWDSDKHRACTFCWKTMTYDGLSLSAHMSLSKDEDMLCYDYDSFKNEYTQKKRNVS